MQRDVNTYKNKNAVSNTHTQEKYPSDWGGEADKHDTPLLRHIFTRRRRTPLGEPL